MAKAKEDIRAPELHEIARELFKGNWRPNTGVDAWMTAVNCYRAAESFCEVAEQISSGMSSDDVIAQRQLEAEAREAKEAEAIAAKRAAAAEAHKPKQPAMSN